jgi:hypothetical protein
VRIGDYEFELINAAEYTWRCSGNGESVVISLPIAEVTTVGDKNIVQYGNGERRCIPDGGEDCKYTVHFDNDPHSNALDVFKNSTEQINEISLGNGVIHVPDMAFYERILSKIDFGPDSALETIGRYAFSCSTLPSITIPRTVKHIDVGAFFSVKTLTEVNFEGNSELRRIGKEAFCKCSLRSIVIPSQVEAIELCAFSSCEKLEQVVFEAGSHLTAIDESAFVKCSALQGIVIPQGVTKIDSCAFNGCCALESVMFEQGSALKEIGARAFNGCTSLRQIVIPNGVRDLDLDVFSGCTALEKIKIPAGVTLDVTSVWRRRMEGAFNIVGSYHLKEIEFEETSQQVCPKMDVVGFFLSAAVGPLDGCKVRFGDHTAWKYDGTSWTPCTEEKKEKEETD